jgi:hypothetical protein
MAKRIRLTEEELAKKILYRISLNNHENCDFDT